MEAAQGTWSTLCQAFSTPLDALRALFPSAKRQIPVQTFPTSPLQAETSSLKKGIEEFCSWQDVFCTKF